MSIGNTNVIAKVAAVVAGLGLVAMSFAVVPAKADTSVQSQIDALMAQIAALQASTGGTSASMMFNTNLTIGSKGADVTALQNWLIKVGQSIPAGATGYFGAQTKAALAAWQAANSISPAAGYFGPITRAKVNAMAGGTTGGTTGGTSTLAGVGRLTSVSSLGDVYTDLKEGDASTAVVGVSANATGGDVQIQRVDATLYVANSGSQSSSLGQYLSDVSVYLDSTKLGTMSASSCDKDGRIWTCRFAGLNGVIKSGNTGNIHVKVTPLSTIGATEDGKTITAAILQNGVRAVGSDGISETYVAGSSFTASGQTVAAMGVSQAFTVSSATTGTLTVSTASDNPKSSQVAVSSSTTSGVTLLSFNAKAKNAAITVTDLVASFNTNDNNLNDVVTTVKLMQGSTVIKSKTLSTGSNGTVIFDKINQTISKDSTTNYTIVVDLKGDAAYNDGTTLIASTTVLGWDVSDATGASVVPSAAAGGNTMTLTATGLTIAKGTFTAVANTCSISGCGDNGLFTMPFTVTAGDSDIFIGAATTRATTPVASAGGVNYATTTSSTNTTSPTIATSFAAADTLTGDVAGTAFKVSAGTSRTFTLSVSATAAATGLFGIQITGINYGPTSALGTTYYTSNLDTFKTTDLSLVKH